MSKSDRIGQLLVELASGHPVSSSTGHPYHPCHEGYRLCFNGGRFYEAHDVLEHLWLKEGPAAADHALHKGLIQLAGAFVHLKLQRESPHHPKHGRRLHPALRLLRLAEQNLASYPSVRHGLDLDQCRRLCVETARTLEEGSCARNPWAPEASPQLRWVAGGEIPDR